MNVTSINKVWGMYYTLTKLSAGYAMHLYIWLCVLSRESGETKSFHGKKVAS